MDRRREKDRRVQCRPSMKATTFTSNRSDEGSKPEDTEETFELSGPGVTAEILKKIDIVASINNIKNIDAYLIKNIEISLQFMSDSYDKLLKEETGLREENKNLKKM